MTAAIRPDATAFLASVDPAMKRLIDRVGPCTMAMRPAHSPYEALMRAVVHQQLNGTAAAAILDRVLARWAGTFPAPEDLLAAPFEDLRGCGLSANKIRALRDLAQKRLDGTVPDRDEIDPLPDADIIARLTVVRGIGRWSVEMFLMFTLGRPDVFPVNDLGVQEGYRLTYALDERPKPKAFEAIGRRYAPHRSTAAWYFWRAVDLGA